MPRIRQTSSNLPRIHVSVKPSTIPPFNVNPREICQSRTNMAIHYKSFYPMPILSQSRLNLPMQYQCLSNLPINNQSAKPMSIHDQLANNMFICRLSIKSLVNTSSSAKHQHRIVTNWQRIGTDHANPTLSEDICASNLGTSQLWGPDRSVSTEDDFTNTVNLK